MAEGGGRRSTLRSADKLSLLVASRPAEWQRRSSSGISVAVIQSSAPSGAGDPHRPRRSADIVCRESGVSCFLISRLPSSFASVLLPARTTCVFFTPNSLTIYPSALFLASALRQKPTGELVHILSSYFVSSLPLMTQSFSPRSIRLSSRGSWSERMVNPILFSLF